MSWEKHIGFFFIHGQFLFILCIVVLANVSCEHSFEPLEENEEFPISIYGYLDASADTQWVRVTPVRNLLKMDAVKPEMTVTLEDLENDRTAILNDSLFTSGGKNFLNFWTTMNIETGQSYLLKAVGPDGATSRVTVTLPDNFPTPLLRKETGYLGAPDTYTLLIDDVDQLADIQVKWYIRLTGSGTDEKRIISFSYRNQAEKTINGGYRLQIVPDMELEQIMNERLLTSDIDIKILHRQIFVASAGPDWKEEIFSIDDLIYALPEGLSNVENGLGYVVGVNGKWIPFSSCRNEQKLLIACPEEKPFW